MIIDVDIEKVHDVETLLRGEGFRPFEVELGGRGVGILEKIDEKMIGMVHSPWKSSLIIGG